MSVIYTLPMAPCVCVGVSGAPSINASSVHPAPQLLLLPMHGGVGGYRVSADPPRRLCAEFQSFIYNSPSFSYIILQIIPNSGGIGPRV